MDFDIDELIIKDKRLLDCPYCQKDTIRPKCGATSGRYYCTGHFPLDWMEKESDGESCLWVQLLTVKGLLNN